MSILFALLLINSVHLTTVQDSSISSVYSIEKGNNFKNYGDLKFFNDPSEQYSINEILQLPESSFIRNSNFNDSHASIIVWSRIELRSNDVKTRSDFFSFSHFADSVWIYRVDALGKIDTSLTGMALNPNDKSLLSVHNYSPFRLTPGQPTTFIFKLKYPPSVPTKDFRNFTIIPGPLLIKQNFHNTTWHYFSFGIMLLFCLLGIFTYFIFRDRIFIYFSLVMFFFGLYFPFAERINIINIPSRFYYPIVFVTVAGIVISFFLFENKYLRLSKYAPSFFRIFLGYTIFVVTLNLYFAYLLLNDTPLLNESIADYAMIPLCS